MRSPGACCTATMPWTRHAVAPRRPAWAGPSGRLLSPPAASPRQALPKGDGRWPAGGPAPNSACIQWSQLHAGCRLTRLLLASPSSASAWRRRWRAAPPPAWRRAATTAGGSCAWCCTQPAGAWARVSSWRELRGAARCGPGPALGAPGRSGQELPTHLPHLLAAPAPAPQRPGVSGRARGRAQLGALRAGGGGHVGRRRARQGSPAWPRGRPRRHRCSRRGQRARWCGGKGRRGPAARQQLLFRCARARRPVCRQRCSRGSPGPAPRATWAARLASVCTAGWRQHGWRRS